MGAMHQADQERFTRLWTHAQPYVAGYIVAVLGDQHAADDALQDVAVVLMRKFPEYDPQRPFIAWAMGAAKTQILSARRDQARTARRLSSSTIESLAVAWQEMLPEADRRTSALDRCVQQLGERGRRLLALRYQQGLAAADIAQRVGSSAGAVRTALARIRSALHDCIARQLGRTETG